MRLKLAYQITLVLVQGEGRAKSQDFMACDYRSCASSRNIFDVVLCTISQEQTRVCPELYGESSEKLDGGVSETAQITKNPQASLTSS